MYAFNGGFRKHLTGWSIFLDGCWTWCPQRWGDVLFSHGTFLHPSNTISSQLIHRHHLRLITVLVTPQFVNRAFSEFWGYLSPEFIILSKEHLFHAQSEALGYLLLARHRAGNSYHLGEAFDPRNLHRQPSFLTSEQSSAVHRHIWINHLIVTVIG